MGACCDNSYLPNRKVNEWVNHDYEPNRRSNNEKQNKSSLYLVPTKPGRQEDPSFGSWDEYGEEASIYKKKNEAGIPLSYEEIQYLRKSKYFWDNSTIPIIIDASIVKANKVKPILEGIKIMEEKTNVRFPLINGKTIYDNWVRIRFNPKAGFIGDSEVGNQRKGEQILRLGKDAQYGNVMHELMHSIGFHHEHQRCDIGGSLCIQHPENVNYKICGITFGTYDPSSIMHYPCSTDLKPKPGKESIMKVAGQRSELSTGDLKAIDVFYPNAAIPKDHNNIKDISQGELPLKVNVSIHSHQLQRWFDDEGWACDGRKQPQGCQSGITGFDQTYGMKRWRCNQCDFDLCEKCLNKYKNGNENEFEYKYQIQYEEYVYEDNA